MYPLLDIIEAHYNVLLEIARDTKLKMPVLKLKDTYYITKNQYYRLDHIVFFRDGIIMPFDIDKALKSMIYVFNDKKIYEQFLFSYHDPYGFGVVYSPNKYTYIPVITTDYLFIIRFLRYFYPNIKEMYIDFKNKNISNS